MTKLAHWSVLGLLLLGACSDGHALAGNWSLASGADVEGMVVEFDGASDKVLVHADVDGRHVHIDGTYSFDAATMAVSVTAKLIGDDQPGEWTGKIVGGSKLELGAADTKLTFNKGGKPHGH